MDWPLLAVQPSAGMAQLVEAVLLCLLLLLHLRLHPWWCVPAEDDEGTQARAGEAVAAEVHSSSS